MNHGLPRSQKWMTVRKLRHASPRISIALSLHSLIYDHKICKTYRKPHYCLAQQDFIPIYLVF